MRRLLALACLASISAGCGAAADPPIPPQAERAAILPGVPTEGPESPSYKAPKAKPAARASQGESGAR